MKSIANGGDQNHKKNYGRNEKFMVGGGQSVRTVLECAFNLLENKMTDKKSVVVTLVNGVERVFKEDEEVSYDYQIGEHNGCLLIWEKRESESVISVPDEEEIVYAYAANSWGGVRLV